MTYKKPVSCFLLLLYLFIATPVQLWHRHAADVPGPDDNRFPLAEHGSVGVAQENGPGSDCALCDHNYSAYTGEMSLSAGVPFFYDAGHPDHLHFAWPDSIRPLLSNKSPPSGPLTCLV